MPTKRRPRDRRWRGRFSAETLELFKQLELTPKRKRHSREFRAKEKELMCRHLDLGGEFWAILSVLDDSSRPNCPRWLHRYTCWFHVHEVRLQLLQALAESLPQRDAEPAPLSVH
jgi:hypothetical protein